MCGIMADMQVILNLVKNLMPKIYEILENKEESCGDFIGNNLINQGLNNLFTNDMLNEETSLLIWDCLFLEGNIILIKSILAIYHSLQKILLKSKRDIETFKNIIDNDLKNIKPDDDKFIDYLLVHKFDFDENYIEEERFKFSSQIAEAYENNTIDIIKSKLKISYKQLNVQLDKTINCNKKWPYCINDTYFENVTQIVFYTTLSKQKLSEKKDDWFFKGLKIKKELQSKNKNKKTNNDKNEENEEKKYNIFIERRPHYCTDKDDNKINSDNGEDKVEDNSKINLNKNKEKDKNIDNGNDINNINNKESHDDKDTNVNKINEQTQNDSNTNNIKIYINEEDYIEDFK